MVLYQPIDGYCYNSDTHFLYDFICKNLEKFKNVKGELLDIGSGSGILGLLVVRNFEKLQLNQVELQKSFQFFSQKNSEINQISSNMFFGSFLEVDFKKEFDICVSNPPFYHSNVIKSENESLKIARYNTSMPLYDFIKKSSEILTKDGKLFFCYDAKQLDMIVLYLKEFKLNIESIQFVHPKKTSDASLIMVYARKNSKSLLKVMKPLIVFSKNAKFKKEIENIYKNINTYSIKAKIE
ncbi:tRNA1(Val) (adenine(37)-N6)-methyltransferase [Arcobacter porcinus]|uniref:tRNA m6A37 methyltransferase n=1 Tax=Arcobacter porcinus TaxID=1935204 RepID=A0A1C0AZ03_9BACT|nr:methyltransferase [Arcobacter porcinus]OCL92349.1 tRNA1(Val) (adenine(37)-N6)-methyltransferase [Aliarcobacter thereius]OCL92881.1 tRNA1(Val) (adenine(37)-N6)-methyltransferase [Arcobacter porcinus]QEP40480.1 tRNA m6A37 methyltransferase [Arcobacter porcinus]